VFLVLAGQLIWTGWRHRSLRPALVALIAGAASYLPWLLFAQPWNTVVRNLDWSWNLGGTAALRIIDVWHSDPGASPLWQMIGPLFALSLAVWGFQRARGSDARWLLLAVGAVPLALAAIALRLGVANLFASERYLLMSIAGWAGFSAIALAGVREVPSLGRPLRMIALGALLISMSVGTIRLASSSETSWREVVRAIDRHIEEGQQAVLLLPGLTPGSRSTLRYYLLQSHGLGQVQVASVAGGGASGISHLLEDPLTGIEVPNHVNRLVIYVGLEPPVGATRIPWIRGLEGRGFGDLQILEVPRGTLVSVYRIGDLRAPHGPPGREMRHSTRIEWLRLEPRSEGASN
jgi:hypothetical protein